jgi:SagB-type dehydrogenase family enzyme
MAAAAEEIKLPSPEKNGGKPLMQALNARKSIRAFDIKRGIPEQELANLLWAAFGINREKSLMRTAPSAHNAQEIDIYVAMQSGLYLYRAQDNVLHKIMDSDVRGYAGKQSFIKDAPLVLIFVADYKKMSDDPQEIKDFYSAIDTGYISQNVYLYCASADLGTVAIGYCDKELLKKAMKLATNQRIILTQPVGYPAP